MFKRGQVLRVARPVTLKVDGVDVTLATRTRVRVNSVDEKSGRWKVRVEDVAQPSLNRRVFLLGARNFNDTHAGRPKGSVAVKPEVVI